MAVIQLMAAVISVWCLEYAGFSLTEYILVTLFIGIILLGAVMFYIRINMVPVFYFLVFILYPITIIQAMHISGSLDKIYDYESFSGTVDNIAYKNDYVMLYLKSNSLNAMGIVVYANSKAADNICVDDELIVYGTVKRFERERNPGNFNSYMYYTSGGYPYKCNADNIELVKGNSDSLKAQLYRLKQRIKNVSGNVGHQFALTAGLITAMDLSDVTVSIDADLQDDVAVIEEMIDKFHNGCDIVYGVRKERKTDTFFKRTTAQGFYKVMEMMGVKTVYNHADFRLMSKRAVEQFSKYQETNLFLRGMMPLIGYQTDCVYYDRKERVAGESKYSLKKMLALAFNGISSFSVKPISMILEPV